MNEGVLPATSSGVPIHSRSLREVEYCPLIQGLKSKICNWVNRKLSYAERYQLILTLLISVQRYLAQIFKFLKAVITQIESICRAFLWYGGENAKKLVVVVWSGIYKRKEQGDLGIKEVLGWNRACLINPLFDIEGAVTSSWEQWVPDYKLQGQNVWELSRAGASHSPFWRELIRVRNFFIAHTTIRATIGTRAGQGM